MSALRYWDEDFEKNQAQALEDIFDKTYEDLIKACREGKVKDDNAVIGSIFSLMERILPKILNAYKDDPDEYDSRLLATATSLRVTINSFIPIKKFMEIMHKPEMEEIDRIVDNMIEHGDEEVDEDELINVFKGIKPVKSTEPDIYG